MFCMITTTIACNQQSSVARTQKKTIPKFVVVTFKNSSHEGGVITVTTRKRIVLRKGRKNDGHSADFVVVVRWCFVLQMLRFFMDENVTKTVWAKLILVDLIRTFSNFSWTKFEIFGLNDFGKKRKRNVFLVFPLTLFALLINQLKSQF